MGYKIADSDFFVHIGIGLRGWIKNGSKMFENFKTLTIDGVKCCKNCGQIFLFVLYYFTC